MRSPPWTAPRVAANWCRNGSSQVVIAMQKQLAADVARSLRLRIRSGEWAGSRRLPAERELAGEYLVARNTLRRAIDAIAADGMVTRAVGRGTFLVVGEEPALATLLDRVLGSSPTDMMALRVILEPRAAALAATHASAAELDAVAAAHRASLAAVEMKPFEEADGRLHQRIFAGTGNGLMIHLHELLRLIRGQAPWQDLKRRSFSTEARDAYTREHAAIVEALLRRDPEAAALAMRRHLATVSGKLFGLEP